MKITITPNHKGDYSDTFDNPVVHAVKETFHDLGYQMRIVYFDSSKGVVKASNHVDARNSDDTIYFDNKYLITAAIPEGTILDDAGVIEFELNWILYDIAMHYPPYTKTEDAVVWFDGVGLPHWSKP